MVANRCRWKDGADDDGLPSAPVPQRAGEDAAFAEEGAPPPFERVNSGLCFDKVRQVRYRGLRPGAKDEILCLLTIDSRPDAFTLIFAGDDPIRLAVDALRCHLEALGRPWTTRWLRRPEGVRWEVGREGKECVRQVKLRDERGQ